MILGKKEVEALSVTSHYLVQIAQRSRYPSDLRKKVADNPKIAEQVIATLKEINEGEIPVNKITPAIVFTDLPEHIHGLVREKKG